MASETTMKPNEQQRFAIATILTNMAESEGQFEPTPEELSRTNERFQILQDNLRKEFRRQEAARSYENVKTIAASIYNGWPKDKILAEIERLRSSLGVGRPEIAVQFRNLTERNPEDLERMLEDLLLLEQIAQLQKDAL